MYASFLAPNFPRAISTPSRAVRKTLRLTTPKAPKADANATSCLPEAVDKFLTTEYRVDNTFLTNLEFLDRGYDHDEFHDADDEHEGLTITEPMDEADLWRFCTGYDVL